MQLLALKAPDEFLSDINNILSLTNRCASLFDKASAYSINGSCINTPCNVNEIIQEVIDLISHKYAKKNVAFHSEFAVNPPTIFADRQNLQHVFGSLFINASDAIHAGNKPGSILVRTCIEKNNFIVSITDNGVGIPQEIIPQLFQPFFSTKDKGDGLGLYLSKGMLNVHKGDLNLFESRPGCTTFKVTLPLETPPADEQTPPVVD